MSKFGERLQELKQKRGLTIKAIGKSVGIPQSRLSELERGVRIPTAGQIERLEKFFDLAPGELGALATPQETSD
jgi:transcriptional regulator with XRE-family HTH domain